MNANACRAQDVNEYVQPTRVCLQGVMGRKIRKLEKVSSCYRYGARDSRHPSGPADFCQVSDSSQKVGNLDFSVKFSYLKTIVGQAKHVHGWPVRDDHSQLLVRLE